jgi:MSHA biogenesis protein MshQ
VYGTYAKLATVANGGKVQNSNGYDIIAAADTAGSTPYDFERVSWSASTGQISMWIRVPTVSHTVDTTLYILYGNTSISTDQQNASGAWTGGSTNAFGGMWHFAEGGSGAVTVIDSTGNSNGFWNSSAGAYTTGITAPNAGSFTGSNSADLNDTGYSPTASISYGGWVKLGQLGSVQRVIAKWDGSHTWLLEVGSGNTWNGYLNAPGHGTVAASSSTGVDQTNWHRTIVTYDGSLIRLYVDGTQVATQAQTGAISTNSHVILAGINEGLTAYLKGTMQDLFVISSVLSADWITADYNNSNSPSTFYTITFP